MRESEVIPMDKLADWKPETYSRMADGGIIFSDWRSIRDAIDAAYKALGKETPRNIPAEIWNLVGLTVDAAKHRQRLVCAGHTMGDRCPHPLLWPHEVIRCYDCGASLCKSCAHKHLWPNGRETGDGHR